ncbi:MAG TPA: DUF3352 domain-containing protein [Allocoleopsis sp.]
MNKKTLKKKTKKNKKFPLILGISLATTLMIGASAIYILFLHKKTEKIPLGAELIPQDAIMTLSVSTDSTQWQQLKQFGTKQTQTVFQTQLNTLENNFLKVHGYNYEKDIKPWIGKQVTMAFLAPQISPQNAWVMILPIDNPLEAQKRLTQNQSDNKTTFTERNYQGTTIRESGNNSSAEKPENQMISTTVIERSLIVTNNGKATEQIIDTYKNKKSLMTTAGYKESLGKINSKNMFGQVYFNIPAMTGMTNTQAEKLAKIEARQGVITTITLESEGIKFNGVSWLKPNSEKKITPANNSKIMPNLQPENTVITVSGGNLTQLWEDYSKNADQNPIFPVTPDNIKKGIKSNLNLDFDTELSNWMKGEFSLSLVTIKQPKPGSLGASLAFMIKTSDRTQTESSLQKLEQFMSKRYQLKTEKTQIKGKEVIKWKSPLGIGMANHGWLDNDVLFINLGADITESIIPKPAKSLVENPLFKQTIRSELNPYNGYFFMDFDQTVNSGNIFLNRFIPNNIKPIVSGIKAIGVTAGIKDEQTTVFDIFVMLHKVQK